jgi:hypothetical protein
MKITNRTKGKTYWTDDVFFFSNTKWYMAKSTHNEMVDLIKSRSFFLLNGTIYYFFESSIPFWQISVSLVKKEANCEAESLKKFFINPLTCLEKYAVFLLMDSIWVSKLGISHKIFINHSLAVATVVVFGFFLKWFE